MKNKNDKHSNTLKLLIIAILFTICIIVLSVRIGYIQFALGKEYLNLRQARARGEMQMDLQAKLTTIESNIIKINKYIWENEINA